MIFMTRISYYTFLILAILTCILKGRAPPDKQSVTLIVAVTRNFEGGPSALSAGEVSSPGNIITG